MEGAPESPGFPGLVAALRAGLPTVNAWPTTEAKEEGEANFDMLPTSFIPSLNNSRRHNAGQEDDADPASRQDPASIDPAGLGPGGIFEGLDALDSQTMQDLLSLGDSYNFAGNPGDLGLAMATWPGIERREFPQEAAPPGPHRRESCESNPVPVPIPTSSSGHPAPSHPAVNFAPLPGDASAVPAGWPNLLPSLSASAAGIARLFPSRLSIDLPGTPGSAPGALHGMSTSPAPGLPSSVSGGLGALDGPLASLPSSRGNSLASPRPNSQASSFEISGGPGGIAPGLSAPAHRRSRSSGVGSTGVSAAVTKPPRRASHTRTASTPGISIAEQGLALPLPLGLSEEDLTALYPSLRDANRNRGGRRVAADPRLDPNISPKRAARILANRISAAKSKNKKREMQAQMQARLNKMRQVAEVMRAEHTTLVTGILGLEAEYQQLEGLIAQLQLQSTQLDAKKQQLEADLVKASQQYVSSSSA